MISTGAPPVPSAPRERSDSSNENIAYRGRFAPSPTGPLHIGSVFTALASFLEARARDGIWLVRIEDIDPFRTRPGASDDILRTLDRFSLHWDEPVVYQSRRLEYYQDLVERLEALDLVYPCVCSRKFLARMRTKQCTDTYPGLCRNKPIDRRHPHALRIRTQEGTIAFDDLLQGTFEHSLRQHIGDFIIRRRDLAYAYQLAVVADDADQQINEVVRGCDLLDSTPRQIFLWRKLQLPTPRYAHIPLIVDENGQKLSKQSRARPVNNDDPSETLFYLLQRLAQSPPLELRGAPPRDLLAWAVAHWDPAKLQNIRTLPL